VDMNNIVIYGNFFNRRNCFVGREGMQIDTYLVTTCVTFQKAGSPSLI
jgi:hypothetical protein